MVSLADMKSHLTELENQKSKLETEIQKAGKRLKMSLWGIGIGILLLPLYWSGVPILVIAGIMAIFYSVKQTNSRDKLESLESEIHKLEISMA
jgi:hypothetical protein